MRGQSRAGHHAPTSWSLVMAALALSVARLAAAAPNTTDVFDHPLRAVLERNTPKLILYTNQNTRDAVAQPADLVANHLKEIPFVLVVHVDLRGVPGFLLGFARHLMQSNQSDGNAKYIELSRAAGLAPADGADRVHVVMEADGAAHEGVGLAKGFTHALAVVLDKAGHEILRTPFPDGSAAVEQALRRAAAADASPEAPGNSAQGTSGR